MTLNYPFQPQNCDPHPPRQQDTGRFRWGARQIPTMQAHVGGGLCPCAPRAHSSLRSSRDKGTCVARRFGSVQLRARRSAQGTVHSSAGFYVVLSSAQHSSAGFNTVLSSGHSTAVLGSMWCSAQGMVLSSGHGAQLCSALSRVFSLARCTAVLGSTQCSAQGMMLSSGHGTAVLGSMWCSAQGTALSSGHGAQLRAQCTAVLSSEQGAQLGTVCNNAGFNTVLSSEHDAQVSMVHSSSWFNMVLSSEQGAQLCTAQQCWVQHRARLRA